MNSSSETNSNEECVSVNRMMEINDTKAGMENLDKERINAIILKSSENSKFFLKQKVREEQQRKKAQEKLDFYRTFSKLDVLNAEKKADDYLRLAESKRDFTRSIVHIDMDAFYANVEIRDDPSLADKPMAVGSDSMLSTSNYIARRFGVRAAMPGFIARELCPNLIIVPCNFKKYREESSKIMQIISQYDTNYSAMSLDEAYLDVTNHMTSRANIESAKRTFPKYFKDLNSNDQSVEKITFDTNLDDCVSEIRHRIYLATNLTASAGVSCNLRLAKLCSDINKPNGQFRLENNLKTIIDFIGSLPIRKMNGIGPSSTLLLNCYGIDLVKDIYEKRAMIFLLETQNTFEFLMHVCRGLGSNVIVNEYDRKSLERSFFRTFSSKISANKDEFLKICSELCEEVSNELVDSNLVTQKAHIKLKTVNFQVYTRTKSLDGYTNQSKDIYEAVEYLILNEWKKSNGKLKLRLIGVRVSDLKDVSIQISKPNIESTSTKMNTIDFFFRKNETKKPTDYETIESNTEDFDNASFRVYEYRICPHCDETIQGNKEYINQHLDLCFNYFKDN